DQRHGRRLGARRAGVVRHRAARVRALETRARRQPGRGREGGGTSPQARGARGGTRRARRDRHQAADRAGGPGASGRGPATRPALDLYAKLRAKSDPDRTGSDLKALATALDELAAKMADIAELAVGPPGAPPVPASPADRFLPSKPNADALRDLVKQQRALHT